MVSAAVLSGMAEERGVPLVTVAQLCQTLGKQAEVGAVGAVPADMAVPEVGRPIMESESRIWVEEIEGDCMLRLYRTSDPKVEIAAIVKGALEGAEGVPARVHSECFTGDVLASKRCDCGQQLHKFLRQVNEEPCGVLLYIRGHEGRGIGLSNKIRAYKLQDEGFDTVDANLELGLPVDVRRYEDALGVLRDLGVRSVRLFTNNPEKVKALRSITQEVVALSSVPCERNISYLKTKIERLNHRTVLETFKLPELKLDTSKLCVGIVYTTWNSYYVNELLKAAESELESAGVRIVKMAVPGACELVSGARAMLRKARPNAIITLGVMIRGSSDSYDVTCTAVMGGLMQLNASQDTPIITGLLMCRDEQQAHERSHGPINAAKAWADTALHMASLSTQLGGSEPRTPGAASPALSATPAFVREASR